MSASSGWVAPAVALLIGGGLWLVAAAWRAWLPAASPSPWALVGVGLGVALADFAFATVFALQAGPPPDLWRPATVAAVVVSGGVMALTAASFRAELVVPCGAVVALALRTAETLGRHLAPLLRTPADVAPGEWADQPREARRAVLEVWVACVLVATASGLRATALPALTAVGASGLAVAAGARLNWADRLAASEGYDWPETDRVRAWVGTGALSVIVLAVALITPGLPPLLSGRVIGAPFVWMIHLLFSGAGGGSPRTSVSSGVPRAAAPALAGALGAFGAVGGLLTGFWELRQTLLVLVPVVIVVVLVTSYLRYVFDPRGGGWWEPFRRLWQALIDFFGFWRWLTGWWDRRAERSARALGAAGARGEPAEVRPNRPGLGWLDPRRAVRAAYRRYLEGGTQASRGREPGETPARYARRLSADLGPAGSDADRLTTAYEEARFSDHRIGRPLAVMAIAAMRRSLAAFRRAK